MTLCTYPSLISSDNFPQDVKDKAKKLLSSCLGGSTGNSINNKIIYFE